MQVHPTDNDDGEQEEQHAQWVATNVRFSPPPRIVLGRPRRWAPVPARPEVSANERITPLDCVRQHIQERLCGCQLTL